MQSEIVPPQIQVQEIAVVFCLDSTVETANFWNREVFPNQLTHLLKALPEAYQAPSPVVTKLCVGTVVFTRSNSDTPVFHNNYFTDFPVFQHDMRNQGFGIGLGHVNTSGESGLATLEGLVAALEMCETIRSDAAKRSKRPIHPNLAARPLRRTPICLVLLISSGNPGGPKTPMQNRNPVFDGVTLDNLPVEFSKRNVKLSCFLPNNSLSPLIEFWDRVGQNREIAPFKVSPRHTILLCGFQPQKHHGTPPKRSVSSTPAAGLDSPSKRGKNSASPNIPTKAPAPSPLMPNADVHRPTIVNGPESDQPALGERKATTENPPADASVASVSLEVTSRDGASENPAILSQGGRIDDGAGAEQAKLATTFASSGPPNSTPVRPPSQPRVITPGPAQSTQMSRNNSHGRSQSTSIPNASTPALRATALINQQIPPTVQKSPQLFSQMAPNHQRSVSQSGPSVSSSSPSLASVQTSPQRSSLATASAPSTLNGAQNNAAIAHLQAMSQLNAQQRLTQNRLGGQAPAPGGANPDMWRGLLLASFPDRTSGGVREFRLRATAKPVSKQTSQFLFWPQQLRISFDELRAYNLEELGGIIKSNTIPLSVFEPDQATNDMSSNPTNDQIYHLILSLLSQKRAGAAIFIPVPITSHPPNTGIFLFVPQSGGPPKLVGAGFFSMSIPPYPPLTDSMPVGGPPNSAMGGGTIGVQHSTSNEPAMNAPPFDQNAQALRINMQLMQQRQLQRQLPGQSPWMQSLPSAPLGNLTGPGMQDSRLVGTAAPVGQIPPQAQAQHRLLANGIGIGGGGGGGGGGTNFMMGSGFQNNVPENTPSMPGAFTFPMGGPTLGSTPSNIGYGGAGMMSSMGTLRPGVLGSGSMAGITPEMIRAFQQGNFNGQGNV